MWWLERIGIFVEIVMQNVYRVREDEIHNWWLWTRKMYWDLGLLPGTCQKWKVSPMGKSRLCAKSGIYFNWIKCLFCHFLGRELFLFFQYVYSADFCRELNLQISCIFKRSIVQIWNTLSLYHFTILKYSFCPDQLLCFNTLTLYHAKASHFPL